MSENPALRRHIIIKTEVQTNCGCSRNGYFCLLDLLSAFTLFPGSSTQGWSYAEKKKNVLKNPSTGLHPPKCSADLPGLLLSQCSAFPRLQARSRHTLSKYIEKHAHQAHLSRLQKPPPPSSLPSPLYTLAAICPPPAFPRCFQPKMG